ncbi:hypothetical protein FOZG_02802 [Fusarium oxysporum Fo47]|uniref:Uncharacterized protein n=1 Tax=Fusarium oxysporum Fo47 TaxID=660027 RepID=W9KQP0_FUSOX|nr:hypothetical protein FOZG_02802 [Fusarium oxysporum Fo47]
MALAMLVEGALIESKESKGFVYKDEENGGRMRRNGPKALL